jgi:hypothetical protein
VDNYERRVEENERWEKTSEESRRSTAELKRLALTVGVALGAVGFLFAGAEGAAALFFCGYVAAGWVFVEGTRKRPPE